MKNQDQTSMTQRLSASQASMLVTGFFVVTLDLLFLIFYLPKITEISIKLAFVVFTAVFLCWYRFAHLSHLIIQIICEVVQNITAPEMRYRYICILSLTKIWKFPL